MASPSSPTHGKKGAMYRQRPNNFIGAGLNDLTIGAYSSGSDTSYFEIEIDAEGTPDTFIWRENGGAYTTGVSITGASQNLAGVNGTLAITFAATTGHTLGDKWVPGKLHSEATTESGATAQITDALMRILDPNNPPTFTDDGGANVLIIDFVRGKATFDANVGNVTVTGDYIPRAAALEKVGYLIGWNFDVGVDLADMNYMGEDWKYSLPGQGGGGGGADAFLIGSDSFMDALVDAADGDQPYCFLELFNYDPDEDQTGDHFNVWATIAGISPGSSLGEIVREPITFQMLGIPSFTEDA